MSESDPTPAPTSTPAAGSSFSGSTPKVRKGLKATKLWPPVVGRMAYVVVVVILLWVAALTIPMPSGFLYGGDDERDRAASQRAWALTGVVGFFGGIVATAVGAFGGPMMPALAVVLWLQLISLIGGNIYFNRTM